MNTHHILQVDDCCLPDRQLHLSGHDDLQQDRAEPDDLVNLRQLLLRLVPVSGVQGGLQ